MEPIFRAAGFLAAVAGGAILALRTWRSRRTFAQLLAAIPLADKSEELLRNLPKAWGALEHENRALRLRAEAEDQVRRNIFQHLKAGVVLLDGERRVRLSNPSAQGMLGLSSNLSAGEALVAAFREPESLRCLEGAYGGTTAEWTLRRQGRILRTRALPFPDPTGFGAWVLVTLDDATRQEALETTRQKFISNASHELKTPVTSIRIAVENLQEGGTVLPEGDVSLRIILRSVDRMTMLLDDISELSRIETGALVLVPVPLSPVAFVADLLDNLRGQTAARQVRIRAQVAEDLTELSFQADPLRLAQLLENLLANAIKFSPQGTEVAFDVARAGSWLVWTVRDQGPGIARQDAERVFERFYRAPSVRAVPGTGLGLAIVKHLALLMGGEVALHSELGKGATFTFRLPLAAPEAAPEAAPQAGAASPLAAEVPWPAL
jgi:two-component system phosphate regulon sensor histidine kinase PhoR